MTEHEQLNAAWDNRDLGAEEAYVKVSPLDPEIVRNALEETHHD